MTEAEIIAAIEALGSPAQMVAALTHLEAGDAFALALVLAAPPSIYRAWDRALIAAYLAGMAANLKD